MPAPIHAKVVIIGSGPAGYTAAILFCFACLYLATAGGGPLSVDEMRKK